MNAPSYVRLKETTCSRVPCNGSGTATFPSMPFSPTSPSMPPGTHFRHNSLPVTLAGLRCTCAVPAICWDYTPQHALRPPPQTPPTPAWTAVSFARVTVPNVRDHGSSLTLRAKEGPKQKKSLRASRAGPLPQLPACAARAALRVRGRLRELLPRPSDSLKFNGRYSSFRLDGSWVATATTLCWGFHRSLRHRPPLTPALECCGEAFRVARVSSPVVLVKCACLGRSK